MNSFKYTNSNKRYHTLDYYYKSKFKCKIFKVSLNAGFTCPNIDGTVGTGGCIYCSNLGSGDFAGNKNDDLIKQFNEVKDIMHKKWPNAKYIGYFQAHTNTYANVNILKQKYETILNLDNVVGLSIATRPDAISDECLDYLEELSKKTFLTIELGLQTIHEKTSIFINRCHTLECFNECVKKLRKRNINVVVHIINGLPYETKEMMLETCKYLNKLDIQGIKIHMLHILKNTKLGYLYNKEPFKILSKEEYVDIVCDQIENLKPEIVVHRITGDPKADDLIEPNWLIKKFTIMNEIDKELAKRDTYQGFNLSILNKTKQIILKNIKKNDIVVDATIGNGNDTLFLSNIVTDGKVFGFDIQDEAISNTKKIINNKNVTLYKENHADIGKVLNEYKNKISLVLFNLGYLPGGDKTVTTNYKTSIQAIKESFNLLNNKGLILIVVYPGHEEGLKESKELLKFINNENYNYKIYHNTDNETAPYLIEIKK